jgi:hypothetical protein
LKSVAKYALLLTVLMIGLGADIQSGCQKPTVDWLYQGKSYLSWAFDSSDGFNFPPFAASTIRVHCDTPLLAAG